MSQTQYVGIDLHRHRSVIVRKSGDGETLGCVRVTEHDDRAALTAWIRVQWAAGEKVQFVVPEL